MIPVYICDDEQAISERLKKIISDQIMILNGDMGPVRVADAPAELLELQTGYSTGNLLSGYRLSGTDQWSCIGAGAEAI